MSKGFEAVMVEGDDGEVYEVPAPVARKLIHVERLAYDMIGILDYGKYPKVPVSNLDELREAFAIEIATKIRNSTGKFQMMREAVAQWLEEGEWKK